MRFIRIPALIMYGAAVAACSGSTSPERSSEITELPRALSAAEQNLIQSSGTFAFGFLREVNRDWMSRNVFISPLSASMALGMTMNGTAGTTFDEMRSTLGFDGQSLSEVNQAYQSLIQLLRDLDPAVVFQLANAIWYDRAFEPSISPTFLADTRQWFDAEIGPLDFGTQASVDSINSWASRHTQDRIDHVIDDTGGDLVMILANAIYFKGDWRYRFDKDLTGPQPFTLASGTVVDVPTMRRNGPVFTGSTTNAQVIELRYGGNAWAMTILLPDSGVSVDDLIEGLTPEAWQSATATLTEHELDVQMPRFRLEWEDSLNDALERLGMRSAFECGLADFSRLSEALARRLCISFVKQNTFVDVNEEGTEAAAVTTVGVRVTSMPMPVLIDHPFVFAIRERLSGTILFLGKIADPR